MSAPDQAILTPISVILNENSVSMISYDSCNDRALTCLPTGH